MLAPFAFRPLPSSPLAPLAFFGGLPAGFSGGAVLAAATRARISARAFSTPGPAAAVPTAAAEEEAAAAEEEEEEGGCSAEAAGAAARHMAANERAVSPCGPWHTWLGLGFGLG